MAYVREVAIGNGKGQIVTMGSPQNFLMGWR